MTKIDFLCRLIFPCCYSSSPTTSSATTSTTACSATTSTTACSATTSTTACSATTSTTATKKRISASLRDDIQEDQYKKREDSIIETDEDDEEEEEKSVNNDHHHHRHVPPRPSKSMVTGTIYGRRRGRVCFCIQNNPLSSKPSLLLELSIPTHLLVKEMQSGVLRIAFKCDQSADMINCPLYSIPMWTLFCNGRKVGFAVRKRTTDKDRRILKTMELVSFGAGVIPNDHPTDEKEDEEVMYMRASYERVVGSSDSESFYLLNPDEFSDQDLSIFLIR
ncbi:hypothetical protein NE237_008341 [Protea cynaroides]|uniref:Protein MIZU-KUSSEI 1-like n=1 Tax=Protea cynaroides TaxID=273540 RepID=A0A9Q0KVP1_9MAGN|nr:hypothetical protein NE237_008341 [Protea cynaroides]